MQPFNTQRYDYRVRLQVPSDTQNAMLLHYLKKIRQPYWSHEYMVLTALRAHWLPFAYANEMRSDPTLSERELRQLVRTSAAALRQQAKMLQMPLLAEIAAENAAENAGLKSYGR